MKKIIFIVTFLLAALLKAGAERIFVHPGTLHTTESLNYVKQRLNSSGADRQPWYQAYLNFSTLGQSKKNYNMYGGDSIATRDGSYNANGRNHKSALESDSYAIYCQALMYKILGDEAYAQKAVAILNDWSSKLKKVVGADKELTVAFNAYFMAVGADLLHGYSGWEAEDVEQAKSMFREVWYPVIQNMYVEMGNGTWDSSGAKCVMAMSVFLEDWEMFDSSYNYFFNGQGNGTVNHYMIETGQCQESSRSQGYVQLGLCNFLEWCEIGYNQGYPEMWNARDGVIGNAIEYHAKYNLGEDVPFRYFPYATPIWGNPPNNAISSDGRGSFKPIYYMAYNHYHNRLDREMPYTERVITEKQTQETTHATITDGAGFGTLFFNNPDQPRVSNTTELKENAECIKTEGNKIIIESCKDKNVVVMDITGRVYVSRKIASDLEYITLNRGLYIVKIENLKALKINV